MKSFFKTFLILVLAIVAATAGWTSCSYIKTQRVADDFGFKNERLELRRSKKDGHLVLLNGWKAIQMDWIQKATADSLSAFGRNGKCGFINNRTGEIAIAKRYHNAYGFSEGLAGVQLNGYIGFIDHQGNVVIDFQFPAYGNDLNDYTFNYGYCVVASEDGKKGIIDKTGTWVVRPEYDYAAVCKDYAIVADDGAQMQISYDGIVENPFVVTDIDALYYYRGNEDEYDYCVEEHYTDFFTYCAGDRWGLMDDNGRRLTRPIYTCITALNDHIFRATLMDGFSEVLLNDKGEVIQ